MSIQEFKMKDEHSRSMTGRAEAMTNGEGPLLASPPAQQSAEQTRSAVLPAQNTRSSLPAQTVRGRLAAVSGEGEAGSSSGFTPAHSVELHIEELVLHGFAAGGRYRIGDALERELTRLVTEQGVPPAISQGVEIARMNAGAFRLKTGSNPEITGAQLAQAIYRGFSK